MEQKIFKWLSLAMVLIMAFSIFPGVSTLATVTYDLTTFVKHDPYGQQTITTGTLQNYIQDRVDADRTYISETISASNDFEYRFTYSRISQTVGAGSAEVYIGAAVGVVAFHSSANYSLMFHDLTGGIPQLVETYNGSSYAVSANGGTQFQTGSLYYVSISRTLGYGYIKTYTDYTFTSVNTTANVTLHGGGAVAYDTTYATLGQYGTGTTTVLGYNLINLYRTDNPSSGLPLVGTTGLTLSATTGNLTMSGSVNSVGSSNVTAVGYQFANYTSNYSSAVMTSGTAVNQGVPFDFTFNVSPADLGLVVGNNYKVRATANNTMGEGYGNDFVFTYVGNPPAQAVVVSFHSASGVGMRIMSSYVALLPADNVTIRGVQVGNVTGVYTSNITQSGSWNGTGGTFGEFSENFTGGTIGQTYFWRAEIFTANWSYGLEKSFVYILAANVTTQDAVQNSSGIATLVGVVNSTGSTGNVTQWGFEIGTSSGVYNMPLYERFDSMGPGTFIGYSAGALTDNVTYYFRAFAYAFTIDDTVGFGYGAEKSFVYHAGTMAGQVASVARNGAAFVNPQLIVSLNGIVTNGSIGVSRVGFWYGTINITPTTPTWQNNVAGITNPYYFGTSFSNILANTTYFWRAGMYINGGWSWTTPDTFVAQIAGFPTANATSSYVDGTFVTLNGGVYTPGSPVVTQVMLQYALDSSFTTNVTEWDSGALAITVNGYLITHGFPGLAPNTHYFWRAGLVAGGAPYWGPYLDFTTGATAPVVEPTAPLTDTLAATSQTVSSFVGGGNLINNYGVQITAFSIEYSLVQGMPPNDLAHPNQLMQVLLGLSFAPSGNWSLGNHYMTINGFQAGQTVYFRAVFWNVNGVPGRGPIKAVLLASAGGPGGSVPPNTGVGGFAGTVRGYMAALGMDNDSGHWGFMLLIMAGLAFLFIIVIIILRQNRTAVLILAGVLGLIELIVFGSFTFTGLLGIGPIIALIILAAGIVVVVIWPFVAKERA